MPEDWRDVLIEFGVDPAWIETFDNDKLTEDEKRKVALSILSGQTTGIPMAPDTVSAGLASNADDLTPAVEAFEKAAPHLMKASDLLSEEEETPPEPHDSEEPQVVGEEKGAFVIAPPIQGNKRDRVFHVEPDGTMTEVGQWLDSPERRNLTGSEIIALLTGLGLDMVNANLYARDRDMRLEGDVAMLAHPAVQRLAAEEARHNELKDEFSRAYVAAQRKKEKT